MKINLQILSTLIILWPGFAFSESKKDKNLEIAQDVRTELRAIVDDIDELIGGTRSDDNRSSSTLRLKATDASSKYTPDEPPSFDINITLKLGKVEAWKDDIKNWTHAKTQK
ncbi:MAG: hypothetical protein KDD38_08780 [Bdellovibrionales bacterium]|nr:hypothetical protein [Bdellovibrionales bacterium]